MAEGKENKRTKRFAVETVGCRLNQYETEKMANQLAQLGLERVDYNQEADLYLINTCTVTGRADASCRHIISRATRRENGAIVVVAGCYVDSEPEKTAQLNGVDFVINNNDKNNITKILKNNFPFLFEAKAETSAPQVIPDFFQHSRAWTKISDGCNQRCAYCIIPNVRGKLTNRPGSEIIEEINLLSNNGYHEVVLTGVHIGQYQWEKVKSIAGLIQHILDHCNISRLRLSSIEPQEVNNDLIDVLKKNGQRTCRHLHIPLQSGSNRILRLMRRPYSARDYLNNLSAVKKNIDGMVIGADIIVGFPGETENDFAESIKVAESGLLDYFHVFSYSDRPGTASSEMRDKINPDVVKQRSKILRDISDQNYKAALRREIGQTAFAISSFNPNKSGNSYLGLTDNYLKIIIPKKFGGSREIIKLEVIAANEKHLVAAI